ncbi:unnamed protein product [Pylaiella littoralis]
MPAAQALTSTQTVVDQPRRYTPYTMLPPLLPMARINIENTRKSNREFIVHTQQIQTEPQSESSYFGVTQHTTHSSTSHRARLEHMICIAPRGGSHYFSSLFRVNR